MTPIVNGLEDEFEGQATVVSLNVGEVENEELQQEYGLRGHPTFVILDEEGQIAQRLIGPQTAVALRDALELVIP